MQKVNINYCMKMDKRKKDSFPSWVILIYGILETLKYVKIIPTMTVNIAGLILGLLSFLYTYRRKRLKGNYIIYFVIYTLMGLFSFIYNGNLDFQELAWPVFFAGIAVLLLAFHIDERFAVIPVYFFTLVMIYMFLRYGAIYDLNLSESRNYSSAYLLSFYSIYLIVREKNRKDKIKIIPLVAVTACAFLSAGRGGMISFLILEALLVLYYILKNKKFSKLRYVSIRQISFIFCLLVVIVVLIKTGILTRILVMMKNMLGLYIQKGFSSSSRNVIWGEYIQKIISTPVSILSGPSISGTTLLDTFHWNLHNSYLMLYARYGTIVCLIVLMKMLKSGTYFLRKKKWVILILMVTVFIRCYTDCIAFNGVMDITWYYLLFAPLYNKGEQNQWIQQNEC